MAILFAAGEQEAFSAGTIAGTDTGVPADSNFQTNSLRLQGGQTLTHNLSSAQTELWIHFRYAFETDTTLADDEILTIEDSATGDIFARLGSINSDLRMQYFNGATFTTISTSGNLAANTTYTIDIRILLSDTVGVIEWFIDGVSQGIFNGDTIQTATATTIDRLVWRTYLHTGGSTQEVNYSEWIVTNSEATTGWRVATLLPTADGNDTAWTGTFADIDDVGTNDDANFITTDTNNNVQNHVMSDLRATAQNFDIMAVIVNHRSRRGATGIQQVQAHVRVNVTNYFGATINPGTAFVPLQEIWANSPDTASAWTVSEVNALQAGVRGIT